jgi:hypothetical protein
VREGASRPFGRPSYGGALVYTSDVGDLQRIAKYFPEVRVLAV